MGERGPHRVSPCARLRAWGAAPVPAHLRCLAPAGCHPDWVIPAPGRCPGGLRSLPPLPSKPCLPPGNRGSQTRKLLGLLALSVEAQHVQRSRGFLGVGGSLLSGGGGAARIWPERWAGAGLRGTLREAVVWAESAFQVSVPREFTEGRCSRAVAGAGTDCLLHRRACQAHLASYLVLLFYF